MSEISTEDLIYAFAHTETWLEDYARSRQLSADELAHRVARAILSKTSGEVLGAEDNMPSLRRAPAEGNKAARKMALAKRAYRKASRKSPASAIKLYWARMTPEQRSAEMTKRMNKWRNKG